jgi:hypothetical protein
MGITLKILPVETLWSPTILISLTRKVSKAERWIVKNKLNK